MDKRNIIFLLICLALISCHKNVIESGGDVSIYGTIKDINNNISLSEADILYDLAFTNNSLLENSSIKSDDKGQFIIRTGWIGSCASDNLKLTMEINHTDYKPLDTLVNINIICYSITNEFYIDIYLESK